MPGPMGRPMMHGFLTEEEKASAPKVTRELLVRISSYLKPYWPQFLLVFVAIIISAVVGLLPAIITGRIVDEALVGTSMELLIQLLLAALAAMLASQLIGVAENYINAWISQRIIFDMKNEMYEHLQHMPHSFFTTEKQGDIVTRMNTDISGVSSVISGTLSQVVSNVATVITTLVALFSMSSKLAVVGLLVLPLLIIPTRSAGRTRLKLVQEAQAKNDEMNQVINETLSVSGSLLMKMFTREDREYENFVKVNEEVTEISMREERSGSLFRVAMGMFTQLGPLLIYFAGGLLIIEKLDPALTVGTVTATVSLINRLYRPVESLMNLSVSFTRSLAMFTRIFDYLDREATITSPENGATPSMELAEIVYDHVAFGYDDAEELTLTDVNFTVPGGKMFAIVGPSGSGKSTVVNLIPRLYDVKAGSVCVAGTDVRNFDLAYLRSNIGVVTQEAYLFNGSILENLRYARENATMEEIEQACRIANIYDFIVSQPEGFNAQVGNRGLKLSGGEKQRISIARVVLKDPKILILDEATSALDSISEQAIQDALEKLMVGRTSIVIAHRLSTILKADEILVVKDGVIEEQGTHEELLELGGVYHELYETQFRQALDFEAAGSAGRASEPCDTAAAGAESKAASTNKDSLDLQPLSSVFTVREVSGSAVTDVSLLMRSNRRYWHEMGERPSMPALTAIMENVPESALGKRFLGFYDSDGGLVAVMDLITGYPTASDALIRWFMVAADMQRQGVGSQLVADIRAALSAQGYTSIQLEAPEHPEVLAFWKDQGFKPTGERDDSGRFPELVLARTI